MRHPLPARALVGLLLISCSRVLALSSAADSSQPEHDHRHIGYVSREIMSRPLPLRAGIGVSHEPVSTTSVEAQRFYDQGQSYLYSYMWIEAARSFHQALRLDRHLAMAYVGLSYAYSPLDYSAARDALAHAEAMSARINEREKLRIEIRRLQLEAMLQAQDSRRLIAFRQGIDSARQQYPNDIALLLLRGNAEEPSPFGDGQACVPSAIPFYKQAAEMSSDNAAANHFLSHCYENRGESDTALAYALKYVHLAPAIAHAHHMLGHELRRTGKVEHAIAEFRRARAIEQMDARADNIPVFLDWHYVHNLVLLADCYHLIGQMKSADAVLREESGLPVFTDYAMLGRSHRILFLLSRNMWIEASQAAAHMEELPSPLAQAAAHALSGEAHMFLKHTDQARQELQSADQISQRLLPQDAAGIRPYILSLEVELGLVDARRQVASALVRELIARLQITNNPDAWGLGLFQLESLGLFAREHAAWDVAEELARAMLEQDPDYAGSHFAAALVAQHRNEAGMENEFATTLDLWVHADPNLPEINYVRRHWHARTLKPGELFPNSGINQ